jgi:hypothetical protein
MGRLLLKKKIKKQSKESKNIKKKINLLKKEMKNLSKTLNE